MEDKLVCSKCGELKDIEKFSIKKNSKRGRSYICKECHNTYSREIWYKQEGCKQKEYSRRWREENVTKRKATLYKTTEEALLSLYEEAGGKRMSCGKESNNLHIDHCHKTNKVRGMLCPTCNTALGLLYDNPEIIIKLFNYINTNK